MTIAIRADGSREIGIGHLMRCLSLAEQLQKQGEIIFLTRNHGFDAAGLIARRGFEAKLLPAPPAGYLPADDDPPHAHWAGVNPDSDIADVSSALRGRAVNRVVIDHYGFDARWHSGAREALNCPVIAIDDLADRPMAVALLIDHNWHADHAAKYSEVLESETPICGGPAYALLAPAYADAQRWSHESVDGIGIFLGGGDLLNLAPAFLAELRAAGYEGTVEIVTTSAARNIDELRELTTRDNRLELSIDLPDLTAFYARRRVQIGAGGGASWERCCIGAPTVLTATADNHRIAQQGLDQVGASIAASRDEVTATTLQLLDDPSRQARLSRAARALVDGLGAARAAEAIEAL